MGICGQIIFWMTLAICHSNHTRCILLLPLGSISQRKNRQTDRQEVLMLSLWASESTTETQGRGRTFLSLKILACRYQMSQPSRHHGITDAINNSFRSNWQRTSLPCSDLSVCPQPGGWKAWRGSGRSQLVSIRALGPAACSLFPSDTPSQCQAAPQPRGPGTVPWAPSSSERWGRAPKLACSPPSHLVDEAQ